MKCPACNFENPDGFAFCGKCGAKLALACPNCGTELPPGFAFCGKCGTRLELEAPPLTRSGQAPTLISEVDLARLQAYLTPHEFSDLPPAPLWEKTHVAQNLAHLNALLDTVITYLPRHLVRAELASNAPLVGGAFLDGALLFADISGFTAMSEQLATLGKEGAEQITALVNHYFDAMLTVIFAHGGDLLKFGGDALLAIFPDSRDAGSASALQAAWAMQEAMAAFRQVRTSLGIFPLKMKIGIHAGEIFAARVGTTDERELVVTGPTVNATAPP